MTPAEIKEWAELAGPVTIAIGTVATAVWKVWVVPARKFFREWRATREDNHAEILTRLDNVSAQLQSHTETLETHSAEIIAIRGRCAQEARQAMSTVT